MADPGLIHLVGAAKAFGRPGLPPSVVLKPTSLSIDPSRPTALLGGRKQGKTTLLRLLAGEARCDAGAVLGTGGLSPVVNAGSLLHPKLSGLDNLRFIGRAYGLDADLLLTALDVLGILDFPLDQPLRAFDPAQRRTLEIGLVAALPFRCCLVDDAGQLEPDLFETLRGAAAARGAGVIFATSQPRFALRYAPAILLLANGSLEMLDDRAAAAQLTEAGWPE